ncbi:MAG: exo-alpha-sialidase [Anaerolineae bacterium]|nr:exo-alpha-sialidase [Anaerolineae bacterium]
MDLALAGDGTLYAVWSEESSGENVNVYHASAAFRDGEWVWSSPRTIESGQRGVPSLAVDSTNRLHVVYLNSTGSKVRYRRGIKSGDTWSWTSAININPPVGFSTTEGAAGAPVIQVTGSRVHLVWFNKDGEGINQIVHAFSTDAGDNWQTAEEIYHSDKHSSYPDLAIGQDGNELHIVWEWNSALYARIYHVVGTFGSGSVSWSTPNDVSQSTNCHRPSIAISDSQLYVTWGQTVGNKTNQNVYYSTKSASGGTWPTPKLLPDSNVGVGDISPTYVAPRIAATGAGRVIIVWNGRPTEGSVEDIHFTETMNIADDTAWTERINVSSTSSISYGPAVVLADNGIVHVLWIDNFEAVYSHSQYGVFLPLIMKNW